jgi:hypothetical protein
MDEAVELTTFTSSCSTYVYVPLPAATSYGHRAELWNPDKWFKVCHLITLCKCVEVCGCFDVHHALSALLMTPCCRKSG